MPPKLKKVQDALDKISRRLKHISLPTREECARNASKTSTENMYYLNQLTGDWIINVDKYTRVPGIGVSSSPGADTEGTGPGANYVCAEAAACKSCADNVRSFEIAEALAWQVKEEISALFVTPLKLVVMATGSYISGTRVLSNDGFDFKIACVKENEFQAANCEKIFATFSTFFHKLSDCVRRRDAPDTPLPRVTSVHPRGPDWCLHITWLTGGSESSIDVHITVGIKHKGHPLQPYCKSLENHHCFAPVYTDLEEEDVICVNNVVNESGVDTHMVDWRLFARLDEINRSVAAVFRFVKVMISLMFPRRVSYCRESAVGFVAVNYIGSDVIQESVLRYYDKFPATEDWSVSHMRTRVSDVIRDLKDCQESDFISSSCQTEEDEIFDYLSDFLEEREYVQLNNKPVAKLECYAMVKQGDYVRVSSINDLRSAVEENHIHSGHVFSDRDNSTLVYFTHEHPLLSGRHRERYHNTLNHLAEHLHGRLKDCKFPAQKPASLTQISDSSEERTLPPISTSRCETTERSGSLSSPYLYSPLYLHTKSSGPRTPRPPKKEVVRARDQATLMISPRGVLPAVKKLPTIQPQSEQLLFNKIMKLYE